jgi:hypothetical protein
MSTKVNRRVSARKLTTRAAQTELIAKAVPKQKCSAKADLRAASKSLKCARKVAKQARIEAGVSAKKASTQGALESAEEGNAPAMKTDGRSYLDLLGDPSCNDFERRFSKISIRLGLGKTLMGCELGLLYEATFCATLCNIAFNGLVGCGGEIKPEQEANRRNLEREFMAARGKLYGSEGWEALSASVKESIQRIFLSVLVAEANLAL